MGADDLLALLPLLVIAAASVVVMLAVAFYRKHMLTVQLTLGGLAIAFISLFAVASVVPRKVTPLIIMDSYALFYMGLIFAASFVVTILSYGYIEGREGRQDEYYILLLLATLGSAVLVSSNHFASFFLGLQILSISLYVLIAYFRVSELGNEAGIKYLILAASSASFLLFGMALVYAQLGTMEFSLIAQRSTAADMRSALLLAGLILITVGAGFKLAVAPFHMWTPDVYEGAPAPVSAFIATVSKGAMLALLLRYFTLVDIRTFGPLFPVFTAIAIASMFTGNLLALFQDNIKRILAYSSIAHLGYMLVAFLASGALAVAAVSYYLIAYFVAILGAFGVITLMSGKVKDADTLDEFRGLAGRRPWLSGIFTAMLLSLAGIPLTAGFIGKFYIVTAGVGSALWLLVLVLAVNSAISLVYYLRIVAALYARSLAEEAVAAPHLSLAGGIVMAVLTLLLVWLGVYPSPFIRMLQTTVARLI
ncbi:MAG: NADH-quinone oxidoreductase subunit N [Nitrospirae bacterium]|nr:NADH-quinone oxidoreductase subunit N [Nitrospirota bacterium]